MKPVPRHFARVIAFMLAFASVVLTYFCLNRMQPLASNPVHLMAQRFPRVEIDPTSPASIRASIEKAVGPINIESDPDQPAFEPLPPLIVSPDNLADLMGNASIALDLLSVVQAEMPERRKFVLHNPTLAQLMQFMQAAVNSDYFYYNPVTRTVNMRANNPRQCLIVQTPWSVTDRNVWGKVPFDDIAFDRVGSTHSYVGSQLFTDASPQDLSLIWQTMEAIRSIHPKDLP